jgi:short-subunit dehydrogenase
VISTSGASDIVDGDNSEWKTYGASKWAIKGYLNALKKSLYEMNIKVTSFFPGGFESNL